MFGIAVLPSTATVAGSLGLLGLGLFGLGLLGTGMLLLRRRRSPAGWPLEGAEETLVPRAE
jgi:hypothetical protein